MFKVETEGDNPVWATIGYLNVSSEYIKFYRSIPVIQELIGSVAVMIQQYFKYLDESTPVSEAIINRINLLTTPVIAEKTEIAPSVTEPQEIVTDIEFEDFKIGDINFLISYFKKDLDKVIYTLLLDDPVLLIGDITDIVQKVTASLELLVPHKIVSKQQITGYIDPKGKDILICRSNTGFIKKYKAITNVDVTSRQISSKIKGLPSISNLIDTLKVAPKETQLVVIKHYVNNLLGKTAELMELCEKDQIDRAEIQEFRAALKGDELNIVISMVKKYAPQFEDKLFYFARSLF
jgi:hypothetical protein